MILVMMVVFSSCCGGPEGGGGEREGRPGHLSCRLGLGLCLLLLLRGIGALVELLIFRSAVQRPIVWCLARRCGGGGRCIRGEG